MRAISLWQPYATAMAVLRVGTARRVKRFETRGWEPSRDMIGERIAICASKAERPRDPDGNVVDLREIWMRLVHRRPDVHAHFAAAGFNDWCDLPRGAVVCHGVLAEVTPTAALLMRGKDTIDELEEAFGNYAPGRFGWRLDDVVTLAKPVPIVGRQGIFLWDERTAA